MNFSLNFVPILYSYSSHVIFIFCLFYNLCDFLDVLNPFRDNAERVVDWWLLVISELKSLISDSHWLRAHREFAQPPYCKRERHPPKKRFREIQHGFKITQSRSVFLCNVNNVFMYFCVYVRVNMFVFYNKSHVT